MTTSFVCEFQSKNLLPRPWCVSEKFLYFLPCVDQKIDIYKHTSHAILLPMLPIQVFDFATLQDDLTKYNAGKREAIKKQNKNGNPPEN